jgi:hypothetical protein
MSATTMLKDSISNVAHNEAHLEGPVARAIENETAKLPSDVFLWTALGSIAASLVLQIVGRKSMSNFVGQWAPTLLILGLYNKLVKVEGSDSQHHSPSKEIDRRDTAKR